MELAFTARVQALGRIAIPVDVRNALSIEEGDIVAVKIQRVNVAKEQDEH